MRKKKEEKKPVSVNSIIGELILKEKYRFVNKQLIAEIVQDAVEIIERNK